MRKLKWVIVEDMISDILPRSACMHAWSLLVLCPPRVIHSRRPCVHPPVFTAHFDPDAIPHTLDRVLVRVRPIISICIPVSNVNVNPIVTAFGRPVTCSTVGLVLRNMRGGLDTRFEVWIGL